MACFIRLAVYTACFLYRKVVLNYVVTVLGDVP